MLRRLSGLPTFLAGLFGAWLLCGEALFHPFTTAATSLYSEGPGHLWGLWAATDSFPRYGGFVRQADVGWPILFRSHLMDPINVLVFGPAYLAGGGGWHGATFAWNLLHAATPLIGAFGVWTLTRRLLGPTHPAVPWASLLGTLAFVASPYFSLYPHMGRTEYLPAVLYPLHVALLHRWMRRSVPLEAGPGGLPPPPPLRVGLGAGFTLGAMALGGWYLAVFGAIADVFLGLVWLRGLRPLEALGRLGLVAGVSGVMLLPALWALVTFGTPVDMTGLTMEPVRCFPGAVLFRMLTVEAGHRLDYEPYIGLLPLVAAAAVAAWRPRIGWVWLLGLLLCLSFSLGRSFAWNPEHLGVCDEGFPTLLTALEKLVPTLRAMRSWSRMMVLASVFGSAALILATGLLWSRLGRLAIPTSLLAGALLVIDNTTYPIATVFPALTFDPAPPEHLLDALATLPPGPVVTLPLDTKIRSQGLEEHGLWDIWQLHMRRPVSAGALGGAAALSTNPLALTAAERQAETVAYFGGKGDREAVEGKPPVAPPSAEDRESVRDGAGLLLLDGFAGLVLVEDMEGGGDLRVLLTGSLGPPTYDVDGVLAWNLHDLPLEVFLDLPGDDGEDEAEDEATGKGTSTGQRASSAAAAPRTPRPPAAGTASAPRGETTEPTPPAPKPRPQPRR